MKDTNSLEFRLEAAAQAIKDDLRGYFKSAPEYRDYLTGLLNEASAAIRDNQQRTRESK